MPALLLGLRKHYELKLSRSPHLQNHLITSILLIFYYLLNYIITLAYRPTRNIPVRGPWAISVFAQYSISLDQILLSDEIVSTHHYL